MDYGSLSPYIRAALDYTIPKYWSFKQRVIFDYELLYVKQGQVVITLEDRSYHCVPGDLFLIKPGKTHMITPLGEVLFRHPHIHFDVFILPDSPEVPVCFQPLREINAEEKKWFREDVLSAPPFNLPDHIRIRNASIAETMMLEIINEFEQKPLFFDQNCKGILIELIIFLLRELDSENIRQSSLVKYNLYNEMNRLRTELDVKVPINELARSANFSKSYFISIFKQLYGITPAKYQQLLRLNKAKHLIRYTALPISAIAEMCGYKSIYALSNAFKALEKVAPTYYRKSNG